MRHVCEQQGWQLGLTGFLAVGWVYSCPLSDRATAQITPDATLGTESSVVRPNANIRGQTADLIEGGAARGTNLFHSFNQFNVGETQQVYFANPVGIENILTRVTGNNLSKILGTLGVNGGASLFLLNPNGIIFGANAKLDVNGSFVASTGKSWVFGNGIEFSATHPQAPPLLTMNITPGVQYGSNQPGATIANAGKLAVGQNLTLSADSLDLQGQLSAGGDLTLQATDTVRVRDRISNPFTASAGGKLVVQGDRNVDIFALNHPTSVFSSGGNMVWRSANSVGGDAHVRVGGNFRVEQLDGNLGNLSSPHDPIFEVAGDFSLANYTGASLQILAGGSVNIPGNVTINGFGGAFNDSSVTLSDGTTLALSGTTRPTLDIRAGTTRFFGTPTPGTPTSADISIGSITLKAPDGVVFLTNQYAPNTLLAGGAIALGEVRTDDGFGGFVGNSGSIIIDSRSGISVTNRIDSSSASGNAGNITLIAKDAISLANSLIVSNTSGLGKGGDINIKAGQLLLSNGAQVSTSTFGSGTGGNLTVNASSSVQLIGTSADGSIRTSLLSETHGSGAGGDLTIDAPQLIVRDGGVVSTGADRAGQGGKLTVNASDSVTVIGRTPDYNNSTGLNADTYGSGAAGDLTINTRQLRVLDGATISASTQDTGRGGALTVNASDSVLLAGISPNGEFTGGLFADTGGLTGLRASGGGGDVTINTRQLIVQGGAWISTSAHGTGQGGKITLNASESVQVIGTSANGRYTSTIFANAERNSTGKGGDITINTPVLLLSEGAQVSASTFSSGQGGNVAVNASSLVQLIGTSADGRFSTALLAIAEGGSTGKAGDLTINTPVLLLSDGAQVGASTFGSGNGGNLIVNASSLVRGIGTSADGRFGSSILAQADRGSTGKAGNLTINTPVLLLSDGAQVATGTLEAGEGGNLIVNASSLVQASGTSTKGAQLISGIFVQAVRGSTGKAGNLTINTPVLLLSDGAQVGASTFGSGNGGNVTVNASSLVQLIGTSADGRTSGVFAQAERGSTGNAGDLTITTGRLIVRDGGQVSAATFETGQGGILDVRASDSIEVSGTSADGQFTSGLYSDSRSAGNARDIRINTGRLIVENGGKVSASGTGTGLSGNLDITADTIVLSNQGSLRATTNAGEGGNIRLKVADSITLRYNSEIVAEAFGTANGGNINVEAGNFIVGVLSEDSDIVANAFQGRGGTISAKAPGIFGFRQFIDRRTPESDFTASSDFGIDGSVELNTQDQLEAPLPTNLVDGTRLIDRRCAPRDRTQERSSFTVTGRGGLPPSPNDPLQGEAVVTNWVTLDSDVENKTPPATTTPKSSAPRQLVEAQGWYFNEKGQVVLTASAPTVTPKGEWLPGANCNPPSAQRQ